MPIRSTRSASTSPSEGRTSRSRGTPRVSGISSQGRSSGSHGDGSPRRTRPIQQSVAKARCRSVSMNDHSPSTLSCSSAGSSSEARPTVSAHSCSMIDHASRKPSASVGRSFTRSGWRRSSSASTSGPTSTPLTRRPMISPEISTSRHEGAADPRPAQVDVVEPGARQVHLTELRSGQVDHLEPRAGQTSLEELLGHALTVRRGDDLVGQAAESGSFQASWLASSPRRRRSSMRLVRRSRCEGTTTA